MIEIKNSPASISNENEQYMSVVTSKTSSSSSKINSSSSCSMDVEKKLKQQRVETVTDPNTISDVSSLKSEAINELMTNQQHRKTHQVEGVNVTKQNIDKKIHRQQNDDNNYHRDGAFDNEKNSKHQHINRYLNPIPMKQKNPTTCLQNFNDNDDDQKPSSSINKNHRSDKSDGVIVRRRKNVFVSGKDIVAALENKHEEHEVSSRDDGNLDDTYHKLLNEFKLSLNHFIELNQVIDILLDSNVNFFV